MKITTTCPSTASSSSQTSPASSGTNGSETTVINHAYEIPMFTGFVLGFPGETDATIEKDGEFAESNGIDFDSLKEFCDMLHTSVHAERGRFGLAADGNEWSHATMTSTRASEIKLAMLERVKNSIYIDADTSLCDQPAAALA